MLDAWKSACVQITAFVFFKGDAKAVSIQRPALSDITVDGTETRHKQDFCALTCHIPFPLIAFGVDSPLVNTALIAFRYQKPSCKVLVQSTFGDNRPHNDSKSGLETRMAITSQPPCDLTPSMRTGYLGFCSRSQLRRDCVA